MVGNYVFFVIADILFADYEKINYLCAARKGDLPCEVEN
jgi:hypothetical protein